MKYGITQKKIARVVKDDGNAGLHAYWDTECGAWIRPVAIMDEVPDGGRMCKHCAKWIDRNCLYGAKRRTDHEAD